MNYMQNTTIRPTQLVAEVTAIMMRLAAALENEPPSMVTVAAYAAKTALREWMEEHEALALVATLTEERRRCVKFSRAASYTRCSGPVCLMCAKTIRIERLNKDWSESHGS
jgi:hypothetical protein